MDLLKLVKEKANYFSDVKDDFGIISVVTHIEIAEKHFKNGKAGEDYLFNDVVYRSNQAFEGALKEAYRIIAGKDSSKLATHIIEKYFEENRILKERVLKLFTNYRTDWRNESTHDYKLYFSEQEALLAIVSISAFVNILLDQMIEKRSYDKETRNLKSGIVPIVETPNTHNFAMRVSELLVSFSSEIHNLQTGTTIPRIMESELIGALRAFFNNFASDIKVNSEYVIAIDNSSLRYYADFLLESKDEKVIIEVKSPINRGSTLISGTRQLMNYLLLTGLKNGILFIPPRSNSEEMIISDIEKNIEGVKYRIYRVCPKNMIKTHEKTFNNK